MTTTKTKTETIVVPAFGVAVDHPRNCDVMLQAIPGCRLRSKLKSVTVAIGGEVRSQQARGMVPPEVPGMELHVNPAACEYVIVDLLNEDETARANLKAFLRRSSGMRTHGELRGVETQKGKLDVHGMKNLCREIIWLLDEGSVAMVKGPRPEMQDVDELPGHYMLNPGARTENQQPTFEKDYEQWKALQR
jgi:hypothetical protein